MEGLNVLGNALKYERSELKIRIKGQASCADGVVIQVEDDDDQGIRHEQVAYVLERGARADTLAQSQGVGLAEVADIMDSNKGDVSAKTSALFGASAIVTLPALMSH